MTMLRTMLLALSALAFLQSTASADVSLTIQNGRVSLVAKDATVRQILTEWARVGQTKVVNVEKIPGGPQTIELTNVPESEALDILLRSVTGFIAAPRTTPAADASASQFDRIFVMPTAASPRPPVTAAAPPPAFGPQPMPTPADDDVDDDRPQPPVAVQPGAPRGPVFNQFPQPQVVNPQGAAPQPFNNGQPQLVQPQQAPPVQQPSAVPTAPFGGVAVPGMVAPAPQQPGQPGQPVRRPDGTIEGP